MIEELEKLLYPDRQLREGKTKASRVLVATERFIKAEREYNNALNDLKKFCIDHQGFFPGSFLKWREERFLSNLNDLITFTFGE